MEASTISNAIQKTTEIISKIMFFNVLGSISNSYHLPFAIALIIVASIVLMIALKFINITEFVPSIKLLLSNQSANYVKGGDTASPLRALLAIVAGSTGLVGIVGISSIAIVAGPGAAFWVLVAPIFLTPLRFGEEFLGHKYRERAHDGSFVGGPSYYLKKGLESIKLGTLGKVLGFSYAIMLLVSSFGGASAYQANQIVQAISVQFPLMGGKEVLMSAILTGLIAFVIFKNVTGVVRILSAVAPVTIVAYFASVFLVIVYNWMHIGSAVKLILTSAFNFKNESEKIVLGIILGISRVALATEVGLGTASVMHSSSANKNSVKEGIMSMASPIVSAFFVGFATIFAVILTGAYQSNVMGVRLVSTALSTVNPHLSLVLVSMVPLMGLSVIIAWSAYGVTSASSIFGSKVAGRIYLIMYMLAVFVGGVVQDFGVILRFTDVINISIAVPNLIGILLLTKNIRAEYLEDKNPTSATKDNGPSEK